MIYEDKNGNIWYDNELDTLSPWEIEELEIHVADGPGGKPGAQRRVARI